MLKMTDLTCQLRFGKAGFTLLEVLIAIAILAVTLTVIFGSQSQSLSLATEARFKTRAAFLLESKIAEIEAGTLDVYRSEGDFGEDFPGFQWEIDVEDVALTEPFLAADPMAALRRIKVTIKWKDSPYAYSVDYYQQPKSGQ